MWSSLSEAEVQLYLCSQASKYNFTINAFISVVCETYYLLIIKVSERFVKVKFLLDAERARTVIELITYKFNRLKNKVRSSTEIHQKCIDIFEQSICEAIGKRRLGQLCRLRRMGHGPRH